MARQALALTISRRIAWCPVVPAEKMRSVVNWVVLGLVIERSSHGYELGRRLERRYSGVLSLGPTHVYAALKALEKAEFIEELDDDETLSLAEVGGTGARRRRHQKVCFRATASGARAYQAWVAGQLREDPRHVALLRGIIGASAIGGRLSAKAMRALVDEYERACMEEARSLPVQPGDSAGTAPAADAAELAERLVLEARRELLGAQVTWIDYARREIDAFDGDASRST